MCAEAGLRKGLEGELVVGHFQFLQHQHIDRVGGEPVQHLGQAHTEGIDVPGGNFHY